MKRLVNRIGETNINNQGLNMRIIGYRNKKDVDVIFEDGYIKYNCIYAHFKDGGVKNPYKKDILGIGFVGEGKYKGGSAYSVWYKMIERCYISNISKSNHPLYFTYKDCYVCTEWHNFQVFAQWYNDNIYRIEDEKIELDKDILIKGNKIYSPNTCIFVPHKINSLFTKSNKTRGDLPIGVHLNRNKKYHVQCTVTNNKIKTIKYLGVYNTPEEAFNIYKEFKESYIKQIANEYKKYIPVKLYQAMINYKVEVTD